MFTFSQKRLHFSGLIKRISYMTLKPIFNNFVLIFILSVLFFEYAHADFKIIIMQDNKGAASKFRPLIDYFDHKGIKVSFVAAKNYPHAAKMFSQGGADGMFSGSGIAGCMIIKELAKPIVRPVNIEGWSTYWAVVLAPKGSSRFTQTAEYFQNKRVIFCGLASSGEFFYRASTGNSIIDAIILKASSHGAAIDALSRGSADIAIVKNRVWDKVRASYQNITRVGEDPGENPDGTLIVSRQTDQKMIEKISSTLLGLNNDSSPQAQLIKKTLKITSYISTDINDFHFTIDLLKRAGVNKSFDFTF